MDDTYKDRLKARDEHGFLNAFVYWDMLTMVKSGCLFQRSLDILLLYSEIVVLRCDKKSLISAKNVSIFYFQCWNVFVSKLYYADEFVHIIWLMFQCDVQESNRNEDSYNYSVLSLQPYLSYFCTKFLLILAENSFMTIFWFFSLCRSLIIEVL